MISKAPRRISIILIFLILILTVSTVYSISVQTRNAVKSDIQGKLESVAGIAALQIDGDNLTMLKPGDENTPGFLQIRDELRLVQKASPDIHYMYTMRMNGSNVEFVVDGDYGYSRDAAAIGEVYPGPNRKFLRVLTIRPQTRSLVPINGGRSFRDIHLSGIITGILWAS